MIHVENALANFNTIAFHNSNLALSGEIEFTTTVEYSGLVDHFVVITIAIYIGYR